MAKKRLTDGLDERISERITKLKSGKASKAYLADLSLPERMREDDEAKIKMSLAPLEIALPKITEILKNTRKYVPHIWDKSGLTATYLLIGKALSNLETIMFLAKKGKNLELVDLTRSGIESLDLAFLFLEEGQEERLAKWFNGKIIKNEKARKQLHQSLNKHPAITEKFSSPIPISDVTNDIYAIYSLYTHSSYGAILDMVDVFREDLDFDGHAGFHYSRQYLHLVYNLALNILLRLQHLFGKVEDWGSFDECTRISKEIGQSDARPEEIKKIFDRYGIQGK